MLKRWRFAWAWFVGVVLALGLPMACDQLGPDQDGDGVPDVIDQCPTVPGPVENLGCPETPVVAYDCDNPPAVTGRILMKRHPIKDRYIVVLKPAGDGKLLSVSDVTSFAAGFQGLTNLQVTKRGFSAMIQDLNTLAKIYKDKRVKFIEQESVKSIRVTWGLDRVDQRDLPLDNTYTPGADGVGVHAAIIDTGVTDVPAEFEGRRSPECFTTVTFGGCNDGHGHGTHVAGTIASKTWGIAKKATVYSVRVLNEQGSGSDTDVIRGIEWVTNKKLADPTQQWVSNMSLGGDPSPSLDQAVCDSIAAGVVHVVAAGNEEVDSRNSSPSRVLQAITMGASDRNDKQAYFSNFGPFVDLYAPGVDVESLTPAGGSTTMSGTSMASPHGTGAAALYLGRHPGATVAAVVEGLVGFATKDKLGDLGEGSPNLLLYVKESATPPGATPPKGDPVGSDRLLRSDGTRLKTLDGQTFDAVMAVPCCMSFVPAGAAQPRRVVPFRPRPLGVEQPTLWPLASEEWMDYTTAKGAANFFHYRGPFLASSEPEWTAIGGAYLPGSLDWNSTYWQRERDLVWHAYGQGAYVEKVVIDTWGCKYSQRGNPYVPWPQDAIDACGRTWHPEHERYARKVVEELGCFGNVVWALDNEGENIQGWRADWYRRLRDAIRDEERVSGCGFVHMIGTSVSDVRSEVDYSITHSRAPLTAPIAGHWTLNNEHNPAFTPAEEEQNFAQARSLGLAWALWRDGMTDADFEDTLGRFKRVVGGQEPPPPPPPPPPPATCTLGTPTARAAATAGMSPTINVQRTNAGPLSEPLAGKWISGTPIASFGVAYCRDAGWTDGRSRCAVAIDGHPGRLACEAHFLEAPCPTFSADRCTGTGYQCPITFDPYIVIGGVNQNHPENVRAGCRESTFVPNPDGSGVLSGEWWKASAHGKGYLKACNADGSVCGVSTFEIDQ